jgi:hypothetical protein
MSQRSNASITVSSVIFASELVKASLSVISLPKALPASNHTNGTERHRISVPIEIPSSSSTLSLELAKNSAAGDVGVLVSVVELSSLLVGTVGKNTSKLSDYNALASIKAPVLASNVITISLFTVSNNLSLSTPTLPTFEAGLDVSNAAVPVGETVHLNHDCSVGVVDSAMVYCRSSQVWLNVTCSGRAVATVKRSCPVFRQLCTVLNLADNSVASTDYCETIETGTGSVLCRCGYNEAATRNRSAALSALNGKVSVAAMGVFASSRLDTSTIAVTRPIAGDVATESMIVFAAFGTLWTVGVACIVVSYSSIVYSKKNAVASLPQGSPADCLTSYVKSVLPISLQTDRWWLVRLWETICVKHKWIGIVRRLAGYRRLDFANEPQERQQRRELLDIVYVVTSLTLSRFVMALFYDLQSPMDDGYCGQWADPGSCQMTKTALDPHIAKCSWIAPPESLIAATVLESSSINEQVISSFVISAEVADGGSESPPCRMNSNTLSSRAFLLAFLITSMLSLILIYLLDVGFDILQAQSLPLSNFKRAHVDVDSFSGVMPSSQEDLIRMNSYRLLPECVLQARSNWIKETQCGPNWEESNAGVELLLELILALANQNDGTQQLEQKVLREEVDRWLPLQRSQSVFWQYGTWVALLLLHGGALYFLLAKAAIRGYSWQIAFFQACISEVLMDIFLIQVIEIVLLSYLLPVMLLSKSLKKVIAVTERKCRNDEGCLVSINVGDATALRDWSSKVKHCPYVPEVALAPFFLISITNMI